MTIDDALAQGITRLRRPAWANPAAYILIDNSPWAKLYDRPTQEVIDEPTPQMVLRISDTCGDYEPYTGPLDSRDRAKEVSDE